MDELQNVEEQIARLTYRQTKLKSDISHYKTALAPHKMLPEHILQLIFQWCIPPDGLPVPIQPRDANESGPSFTRVCSSWRKLAMNTPELWRDVAVDLCRDRHNDSRINLAHEWLSHAGDMLRSLKIEAHYPRNTSDIDRLIVPFSFRSLDLSLTRDQFQRVLTLPLQTQSLHLGAPFSRDIYEDCSACNMITTLPWSQLCHLRIDDASISTSTLISALGGCLVLEELWLILCPDPAPCDAPASFITVPNLRKLSLYFMTGSNPEMFFRSLILPQIEHLKISMTGGFHMEMPGYTSLHFANMAQRSSMSQIQSLRLGKGAKPYRLVDLLKHTPSLSRLEVNGDVVFDSQTLEDVSTGQLGPNITTLYLLEVEDSLRIFQMVWTRFHHAKNTEASVTPIMYVQTSVPPVAEKPEVNRWFDRLRDLGILCFYQYFHRV